MRNLHSTLHLQHHRHTGRLLHHHHTSYLALAIVFVVAGVFIVGLNMANRAAADDFGVAAMVAAPIPTNPPIISSPGTDSTINGPSVLVIGSCPMVTPQPLVSIAVDGTAAGTGACDSQNDFSVPVTLSSGSHTITATALTVTGGKGPTSEPIQVRANKGSAPAIAISSDEPFVYAGAKDITWAGSIGSTGQGNVFAHIDWGDNSQTNQTVQAGPQSFTHHYATLASHNILIAVSNASGQASSQQFAVSSFTTYTAPVASTTATSAPFNTRTVVGLYGLYVSALAVTGIIWLEAKHAARQHALQHAAV